MMKIMHHGRHSILFVIALLMLQACSGNRYEEDIEKKLESLAPRLETLKSQLDSKRLINAEIVKVYAEKLIQQDPAMSSVADRLKQDSTSQGTLYQNLVRRTKNLNRAPKTEQEYGLAIEEFQSIYAGSDPVVFNDALLDLVNTLADLSQGKLARVNIPSESSGAQGTNSRVPGSYLVGNPSYGNWRTDSRGGSFWEWYGKYAMFRSVLGFAGYGFHRGPIYYGSWYSRPHYSYYHDYGRNSYGSSHSRESWRRGRESLAKKGITPAKPAKNYSSVEGQKRTSTYARGRQANRKQYGAKTHSSSSRSTSSTKRRSTYSSYRSGGRGTSSSRGWGFGK